MANRIWLLTRLFIGQPSQVYYNYVNAGIWGGDAKELAEMALFNANGTIVPSR